MKISTLHICFLTVLMVLTGGASDLWALRVMTLEECIDSALVRNPAVNAAALDVEKARILKGTSFDAPFTEILLKQETTGGGGPENGVMFSQQFDFPSVYVARHRSLDAAYRLEQSRFELQMARTAREVEEAYYNLVYRRRLLQLNSELGAIYDKFLSTATIRFNEGEAGALEVMNAERMVEKNRMEREGIEADMAADMALLRRLTYSGCDVMPADTAQRRLTRPDGDYDFGTSLRGSEAAGMLALADREVALAKNEFLPGISVGATVQALIKGFNPYHIERNRFEPGNFMGIEVGISVPLFFGAQRSRLKAANAEKAATLLRTEYAEAETLGEVASLRARLDIMEKKLLGLQQESAPRAREISRIATVSYDLGEIDYLEYIANMETAYSVYRDLEDAVYEYNQTIIRLNEITATR